MPVGPEVEHVHFGGHLRGEGPEDQGAAVTSSHQQATKPWLGPSVEDGEDEEEKPQLHRSITDFYMPTKAEMAAHRADGHPLYRSWHSDCVEGFGR